MIDHDRVDTLRAELGDDNVAEVVAMFCEEIDETLRGQLDQALSVETAHFLKGSALNVGLAGMATTCQKAEHSLRAGQPSPCTPQDVRVIFEREVAELKQTLGL